MTTELSTHLEKTAVLVVDLQNDYWHSKGSLAKIGYDIFKAQKALPKVNALLAAMRKKGVPIVFTRMTEDPNYLQENIRKKFRQLFGNWSMATPGTWGHELLVDAKKDEAVLDKYTYDAFSNPQLKKHLEELGVKTLIVLGGFTHACVDTTVRTAFTHGYEVILATDLLLVPKHLEEQHKTALETMTALFAYPTTSNDLIEVKKDGQ